MPGKFLRHTSNDGGGTSAKPWKNYGQCLPTTNYKSTAVIDGLLIIKHGVIKYPVYKQQNNAATNHYISNKRKVV